mmetsp:Transcript_43830/g.130909  ORF Transcript_43830/g.130909 Transcript_43830/m.130909 type:complete len:246 (+) Transcript_43830:317-1054(+)
MAIPRAPTNWLRLAPRYAHVCRCRRQVPLQGLQARLAGALRVRTRRQQLHHGPVSRQGSSRLACDPKLGEEEQAKRRRAAVRSQTTEGALLAQEARHDASSAVQPEGPEQVAHQHVWIGADHGTWQRCAHVEGPRKVRQRGARLRGGPVQYAAEAEALPPVDQERGVLGSAFALATAPQQPAVDSSADGGPRRRPIGNSLRRGSACLPGAQLHWCQAHVLEPDVGWRSRVQIEGQLHEKAVSVQG